MVVWYLCVGDLSTKTRGCEHHWKQRCRFCRLSRLTTQWHRGLLRSPTRAVFDQYWPQREFGSVKVSPFDAAIGGASLEQTLQLALNVGPMGAALRESPERAETVADAVRDVLSEYATPNGVLMPAAVWIVSAHSENRS